VDTHSNAKIARVGTQFCLQMLHHRVEGHHAIACESGHDESVVLARLRDAARRDVAVSDRFNLQTNKQQEARLEWWQSIWQ
jgi:hypothetical protein